MSEGGCFVCESSAVAIDEHHVVQRSRGGLNLATVMLCPTCHSTVHSSAKRAVRGKSYSTNIAHLSQPARTRADFLVKAIVAVEIEERTNPNPMIAVVLDDRRYLDGLNKMQSDMGFSSRDKLLNAIFRDVADRYGLLGDDRSLDRIVVSLSELRRGKA